MRRRTPARRAPCCSPSRWRSARGASGRCSCAACRRGRSRGAGAPEPFLSDERRRELAAASGLRLRPREDALARERYLFYACVSRATERSCSATAAPTRRATWRCARRSSPTSRSCSIPDWPERRAPAAARRRRLAGRTRRRPRASARAAAAAAARRSPATADRRCARCSRRRAASRPPHARSSPAGRSRRYARLPGQLAGRARAAAGARSSPTPEPLARGSYMHEALEELLAAARRPRSRRSRCPRARRSSRSVLAELPRRRSRAGRPEAVRAAALRAIEADLRRYLEPRGGRRLRLASRRRSSCGSGSRTTRTRCRRSSWAAAGNRPGARA